MFIFLTLTRSNLNGYDISNWEAGININNVPGDFVIVKATQGTSYVNPQFTTQVQGAKAAGKLIGVYHYASGGGAANEAQFFLNHVKPYIGEAILCLDWEKNQNPQYSNGPTYGKQFLDYVYSNTGVKPLIYMSKSVCREFNWANVKNGDYDLWAAQYANEKPTGYQTNPWTDSKGFGAWSWPAIYQYTETGRLSGYNGDLDLNLAYMSKEAWKKYAAKH